MLCLALIMKKSMPHSVTKAVYKSEPAKSNLSTRASRSLSPAGRSISIDSSQGESFLSSGLNQDTQNDTIWFQQADFIKQTGHFFLSIFLISLHC